MIAYKNTSRSVKTFYGVTFKPGEVHAVPGFINYPRMLRVTEVPQELPKEPKKSPVPKQAAKPAKQPTQSIDKPIITQGGELDGSDNH